MGPFLSVKEPCLDGASQLYIIREKELGLNKEWSLSLPFSESRMLQLLDKGPSMTPNEKQRICLWFGTQKTWIAALAQLLPAV